ncbi:MAG: RNA polymerase sigma factor [Candidatus Dojkabacteria bacterium]|nr:RNA polymerase sigma factor [Candidatus Dojkabacteria bacterium]
MNTSLETIYKEYIDDIYRFCYFKLSSKEEAEDVSAEVFIRLANQDITEIRNVRAWLYTVARNLIINTYRKRKNNISIDGSFGENESGDSFNIEEILADKENFEEELIKEDLLEKIKNSLKELDDISAEVITLRIWEEFKFKEISEIVNISEDAVKKKFYRGIDVIKVAIKMAENNDKKTQGANNSDERLIVSAIQKLGSIDSYKADQFFKNELLEDIKEIESKKEEDKRPVSSLIFLNGGKILLSSFTLIFLGIASLFVLLSVLSNHGNNNSTFQEDKENNDQELLDGTGNR